MKNKVGEVIGVRVDVPNGRGKCIFKAHITFVVDGVFSKYRRELASDFKTSAGSSFVGMSLFNADVPAKYNGNVIFCFDKLCCVYLMLFTITLNTLESELDN